MPEWAWPSTTTEEFDAFHGFMLITIYKMLSYRRETALQGALQFSQKVEDWNWETIFYGHYRSTFHHNRPENLLNSVKKCKIRAITAFKVIEVGTNRKPVCDFLLVINSN